MDVGKLWDLYKRVDDENSLAAGIEGSQSDGKWCCYIIFKCIATERCKLSK